MKTKIKKLKGCVTHLEIEIPEATVAGVLDEVYKEIIKVAAVPGFRVGKAPRDLVIKLHKDKAKEEALRRLISKGYAYAVEQHNVDPVGNPAISDVRLEETTPLRFKVTLDRRPEFRLKAYKKIQITRTIASVKDLDVNAMLDNLREYSATYAPKEDQPLKAEDYAVCDLEYIVDGKTQKRENAWFCMDRTTVMPGLVEGMLGMKKGDQKQISALFPKEFPQKNLAGKDVLYKVNVKEVKEKRLPDLNDDLAKRMGAESLDILKKRVREELTARLAVETETALKNQLLKRLVDENSFDVPASMIARQLAYLVEGAKARLAQKGVKREELDGKTAELEGRFQDEALRGVRLLFILNEIARLERITVSDEDVERAFQAISARTGQSITKVKAHYEKNNLGDSFRHKMQEEKVMDFLLKEAVITEKKEAKK